MSHEQCKGHAIIDTPESRITAYTWVTNYVAVHVSHKLCERVTKTYVITIPSCVHTRESRTMWLYLCTHVYSIHMNIDEDIDVPPQQRLSQSWCFLKYSTRHNLFADESRTMVLVLKKSAAVYATARCSVLQCCNVMRSTVSCSVALCCGVLRHMRSSIFHRAHICKDRWIHLRSVWKQHRTTSKIKHLYMYLDICICVFRGVFAQHTTQSYKQGT